MEVLGTRLAERWRRRAVVGFKLSLLVVALWLAARLLADLAWEDLARRLEAAHWGWLVAAVVALVVRFQIWDGRWRCALARAGTLPPRRVSLAAVLAAAMANTVTPAARILGGVLRARYLSRSSGAPVGRSYGSVLFDQVAHQGVIGAVTVLALIVATATGGRPRVAAGLAAATLLLVLLFVLWLRRRGDGFEAGLVRWLAERAAGGDGSESGRWSRLVAHGREAVVVVRDLLADRGLRWRAVLLGVLFFAVNAAAQWMVFAALGTPSSFAVVLSVVALGAAAGVLVGTPGGVGGAEAAMIAAFAAFGMDRLDAAAGTLIYRALHYLVILGLGIPSLLWLEARFGVPELAAGEADDGGDGGRGASDGVAGEAAGEVAAG